MRGQKQIRLNTIDLVKRLTEKRLKGTDTERLAWCFHKALANRLPQHADWQQNLPVVEKVALSGGVFQNCLLLRLTEELLQKKDFEVLRHHMIPPNDGGIAIGQAAYGMAAEPSATIVKVCSDSGNNDSIIYIMYCFYNKNVGS